MSCWDRESFKAREIERPVSSSRRPPKGFFPNDTKKERKRGLPEKGTEDNKMGNLGGGTSHKQEIREKRKGWSWRRAQGSCKSAR